MAASLWLKAFQCLHHWVHQWFSFTQELQESKDLTIKCSGGCKSSLELIGGPIFGNTPMFRGHVDETPPHDVWLSVGLCGSACRGKSWSLGDLGNHRLYRVFTPIKNGNQSYTLTTNNWTNQNLKQLTNEILRSLISAPWAEVKALGLDELSESSRASAAAKENMWRARGACRQRIAGLLLSTLKLKWSMWRVNLLGQEDRTKNHRQRETKELGEHQH